VGRGATGREDQLSEKPEQPTTVPVGLTQFKRDFRSVRRLADRDHTNIASWSMFDHGNHFAGHDAPQALVTDIRNFFRHHTRRAADQFNAPAEGQGG
jgi:epoxide hydrolase